MARKPRQMNMSPRRNGTRRVSLPAGVLLSTSLASGCISVRSDSQSTAQGWPPAVEAPRRPLKLQVTTRATVNGEPQDIAGEYTEEVRNAAFEVYASSGLFASVAPGLPGKSDDDALLAELEVVSAGEFNMGLAILCGLTLTVFPAFVTEDVVVTTRFRDSSGRTLGTISKEGTVSTAIELLLVFGMPFAFPTGVYRALQTDLHRATIEEAARKGLLAPGGPRATRSAGRRAS